MQLFINRLKPYLDKLKTSDSIIIWGCGEIGVDLK